MTGALLTSLYTFRMILLAFFGRQQLQVKAESGLAVRVSLIVLCFLSLVGGYVDTPPHFGGVPALSNFLNSVLPALEEVHVGPITEIVTALSASTMFALGLGLAYLVFGPKRSRLPARNLLEQLSLAGWGFDWFYDKLLVRPFQWLTRKTASDLVDGPVNGLAQVTVLGYRALRLTQTGRVRWYAAGLAMGTVATLAIALLVR
jgi:NADH-quinone oxidoreductase subunit L